MGRHPSAVSPVPPRPLLWRCSAETEATSEGLPANEAALMAVSETALMAVFMETEDSNEGLAANEAALMAALIETEDSGQ